MISASAAGPQLVASPYPQSYLQYSQVIQALPPHFHGQVSAACSSPVAEPGFCETCYRAVVTKHVTSVTAARLLLMSLRRLRKHLQEDEFTFRLLCFLKRGADFVLSL